MMGSQAHYAVSSNKHMANVLGDVPALSLSHTDTQGLCMQCHSCTIEAAVCEWPVHGMCTGTAGTTAAPV